MHGARARRPAAASGSALQCTFVRWATVGGGRARADQLRAKLPRLAALKDEVEPDVPAPHRVKLHSTDPIKRRNGEIKRRTEVIGIFPNEGAASVHDSDVWQMAIFLRIVDAIASYEDVADTKADEIDRRLDFPPLRLVEQGASP